MFALRAAFVAAMAWAGWSHSAVAAVVAAGEKHSLFIIEPGTLYVTGENTSGQLGTGGGSVSTPVLLRPDIRAVAAGRAHSLFIDNNAVLWGMGWNEYRQLGGLSQAPVLRPIQIATDVVSVAAGHDHTMFIKRDGSLWALGNNATGQLGLGNTPVQGPGPQKVADGVAAVSAGKYHTLFLKTDGTLWGMGYNLSGALGSELHAIYRTPILLATEVVAIAAGQAHTLFIKRDASLWGMGENTKGQLGTDTYVSKTEPVKIADNVARVVAGQAFTMFFDYENRTWAMGDNSSGQLGVGSGGPVTRNNPTVLNQRFCDLSAGFAHVLYCNISGQLMAGGEASDGRLGLGSSTEDHVIPKGLPFGWYRRPELQLTGDLAFGEITLGAELRKSVFLTNAGNYPLGAGPQLDHSNPSFWSPPLPRPIPPGTVSVDVFFRPLTAGLISGTLTVPVPPFFGTHSLAESGTGALSVTKAISLNGPLNFGAIPVGSSGTQTLVIRNEGNSVLAISGISHSLSAFSGDFSGTIPVGETRNVEIVYASLTQGHVMGTLTVLSDATTVENATQEMAVGIPATVSGTIFDIDFNAPEHTLDAVASTGNGPKLVTAVGGTPMVRAQSGVLEDRPLERQRSSRGGRLANSGSVKFSGLQN